MKTKILAVALLSALSTSAMAEGLYAAVDVGQSTAKDMCVGLPAGFSCNEKATAFRFGGGYQFTPNLGIEASYGILGKPTMSGTVLGTAISGEAKANTLQVSATGTFPLADTFSLIGKLGIARTSLDVTATGVVLVHQAAQPVPNWLTALAHNSTSPRASVYAPSTKIWVK